VDAGGSLHDLLFAESEISNPLPDGVKASLTDTGFDLDDTCTGDGQGDSCVEPAWATAPHTDAQGGVDNAWGTTWGGDLRLEANSPRMLFRVSSYSGQSDDDHVEVSLYVGLGVAPRTGDGDGGSPPLWDGNDRFNIMQESLAPSAVPNVDEPLYRDELAYVSNWTLVAHFPKAIWSTSNVQAPYELGTVSQVVLAGTLTHAGDQWALQDAVVGMRIPVNNLLSYVAVFPDNVAPGELVCQNADTYHAFRQATCSLVDISLIPGPRSARCDAVSSGELFQAKQVLFGKALPPTRVPAITCAPGIHPTTDPCEAAGD
jgi:hypothetical protein